MTRTLVDGINNLERLAVWKKLPTGRHRRSVECVQLFILLTLSMTLNVKFPGQWIGRGELIACLLDLILAL
jgi:hypothetical protein